MPDLNSSLCVPSVKLANLRDTLAERAEHVREWFAEIEDANVARSLLSQRDVANLNDFLFELEGDLDDWARFLTDQLGDDAE